MQPLDGDRRWLDDGRRPVAARVWEPESPTGGGLVIVSPPGYEYSQTYPMWTLLGSELSARGIRCIRVDPYGVGDSAGESTQMESIDDLVDAVARARDHLLTAGSSHVALIGCRLTATMVLLHGELIGASAVVALAPVVKGRRFVREARMIGVSFPGDRGHISVAGYVYSAALVEQLAQIDAECFPPPVIPTLIVAGRAGGPEASLEEQWDDRRVTYRVAESLEQQLTLPSEVGSVDDVLVSDVAEWIARILPCDETAPATDMADPLISAAIPWRERSVVEELVTVGPDHLAGVLTRTATTGDPAGQLVVFLNSGSDPHTGPARAWVEFARDLVNDHRSVLRIDFSGWGDSRPSTTGRGRPYQMHTVDETTRLVQWLEEHGWSQVVLAGLCAGAWVALQVARAGRSDGVLALNPQLYRQPGEEFGATMADTRRARSAEIEYFRAEAERGRWDAEDAAGLRPPAGLWLDELDRGGTPVALVFAEGDDGIEFLRDRLGRRLAAVCEQGRIRVTEVPEVDHGMHRAWLKESVLAALTSELERMAVVG